MAILPRRGKRKRTQAGDVVRAVVLFLVFFGLSIVVHETFHLLVARALGYQASIFYGVGFPNVYGVVNIVPPPQGLDTVLTFSAGGLGAGLVFFVLWYTIEDIVAKLLLSFFTLTQVTYGVLEPMYGLGLVGLDLLRVAPMVVGSAALIAFRIVYWKLGWW